MGILTSATSILRNAVTTARTPLGRHTIVVGSISFALYLVYEKILQPPPSLRHIPHLNFFMLFKALVMRKSVDQVLEEVYTSDVFQSNGTGIYLRRDNVCWSVRITRPQDVKFVMTRRELFPKSSGSKRTRKGTLSGRAFIASNILYAVGDEWKRHRKIVNPAFHQAMPMKVFASVSQKAIDIINLNAATEVHDLSHRWALDAMGKTIFDFNFDTLGDKQSEWILRFERIVEVVQNPVYFVMPFIERHFKFMFPQLNKAHQEMTVYANMINDIVRRKREAIMRGETSNIPEHEKDLLTLMIEASMKGQEYFSDEEFQANIFVFFLVGHEATSSTMAYILYYLAANQEIQQRAREEAIHVFGDGYDIQPTFEDTKNLPYITSIIKETLRLSTPITHLADRIATRDTEIAGTFIPKGTHVGLTFPEVHRNPETWKDPDTFNPDRFAAGSEADQLDGLPWTPFGNGGARACIGMKSTMTQKLVFLSMLLRKHKLSLPEDSIHKNGLVAEGYMVMRPKDIQIIFEKRY
ncbi:cytochrome P450 [Fennellomyces sp. T-0311]|nr:cytochrome P450 [Fennellomyces sp. T-0311]